MSEQLTNNAQARALKLELENRKLLSTIDSLKEHNFKEGAAKILDLEKEKKKLTLKCEQLQESIERLTQQNSEYLHIFKRASKLTLIPLLPDELENLFKNALQENRKLQDSLDASKAISDRQSQDLQNERQRLADMAKNMEALSKEKQRVQSLCDSVKKRADDAEKSLGQMVEQMRVLREEVERGRDAEKLGEEMKDKVAGLEKENCGLQKEVGKLKELIEVSRKILYVVKYVSKDVIVRSSVSCHSPFVFGKFCIRFAN